MTAILSANALGQLLSLVTLPILSRLFSPSSFGTYSYLLGIVLIVTTVSSLRLELAIPLIADDNAALHLSRLCMILASSVACALALFFSIGAATKQWLPQLRGSMFLAVTAALLVAFMGFFSVQSQLALRRKGYTQVASRTFMQSSAIPLAQVAFGLATEQAGGLLIGQLVGRSAGVLSLMSANGFTWGGISRARAVVRRYWRFPAIFAPSGLLNALGLQLPVILVTQWFGPAQAGNLAMAVRMGMAPAAILGAAVSQVFLAEISSRLRNGGGSTVTVYLRVSKAMGAFGLIVACMAAFVIPQILDVVLGGGWSASGKYLRSMSLSLGLGLVVSPVSGVFVAHQQAKMNLGLDICRIFLVAVPGWISFRQGDSATTCVWYMFAGQATNYALTWLTGLWAASRDR